MSSSRAEWDAKHSLAAKEAAEAPAGILTELWPLLPTGAALDLACGRGRNAIFLAEHGRPVTAVDWSPAALDVLEKRAQTLHLPVRRIQRIEKPKQARAGIDLVEADLESAQLEV
ncbi:MAG TPA: methyltransferase domain-containing protein, partial [Candidatus Acidoferrum sp.]